MDIGDDSNALILPAITKKKFKSKLKPQITISKDKKTSKSQQRKLRRLEEKQKEQLLAESLKILEKHKIRDGAHSFLLSSEKIGQRETTKEKRRRDMQFSKAGLQVPESEKRSKRKIIESCEDEADASETSPSRVDDKNVVLQPVVIEKTSTSLESSQGPNHQSRVDSSCGAVPNGLIKEITSSDDSQVVKLDVSGALVSTSPDNDLIPVVELDRLDESRADTDDGTRCVGSDQPQGPTVPPTVIHVSRPKEVVKSRKDLPIIMMEQEIMEAINNHKSVIICGETGCGKTTQIPQFLYEAGYGSAKCSMKSGIIGVTQPRRVAVLSTARRVAYELGVRLGKEVGFQVRHDKKIGENSSIKFMTDGILLRELQSDFLLRRYSVIILDEAHERSLNTDILIGMLSRIIEERQMTFEDQQQKLQAGVEIDPKFRIYPLKLILMSATLRIEDFTSGNRIFRGTPPVIEIPTRQFPVTRHFAKKTELEDYIGEAYKKVLKIHKRLPPGGILVFVTGQREVEDLCRKLRQASRQFKKETVDVNIQNTSIETDMTKIDGHDITELDEALDGTSTNTPQLTRFSRYDEYHDDFDDHESYRSDIMGTEINSEEESDDESDSDFEMDDEHHQTTSQVDDSVADVSLDSLQAAFEALAGKSVSTSESNAAGANTAVLDNCPLKKCGTSNEQFRGKTSNVGPLHVLPLYAMLPAAAQLRVFEEVKEGERLVVVATNVAETSLTIPGIKYVVDTGREKVKLYNTSNGMESYEIQWISKASAAQRAGRAGRTGPGHCYCLYSAAALTNEFPEFSCAEILKTPVDGVVLLLKSMRIKVVTKFPFPTPPDATDLVEAEKCLKALEALDSDGNLTQLGKAMAQYPMGTRHSKLLLLAMQIINTDISLERRNLILGYAVAIAAALSLSNPFLSEFGPTDNSDSVEQYDDRAHKLKLTRRQIKENRAKLYNLKSDALTVAYALRCFEQSDGASSFCSIYALNLKTMEEMSKLRKLILQLIFNQRYCGPQEAFSWTHGTKENIEYSWTASSTKNTLSDIEEDVLCQAICAGWPDRVAKQIRGVKVLADEDRKVSAVRYQALNVSETVFLRRWSTISRSAPEFLVYHEMQHIKRAYIHGATSVKPEWLVKYAGSLCTYSAPLADRNPIYDPYSDQVFCYVVPYFGPHLWELPHCKVPIKDIERRVAAFAYALLDGQVLPCLKSEKKHMSAPPSSILKPESLCQKRVHNLLCQLSTRSRTIASCEKLQETWKENPRFLYVEVMAWFQDVFHHRFSELMAKMQREVCLAPKDRFLGRSK
ncbi:hypothetical protein RND81_04G089600 [Saponaria officinalis]|uniref:RNA helicase n=1 Tax=Saponaria officinalis TaxID=3572 RepID=A0AAW1LG19_SAPOF